MTDPTIDDVFNQLDEDRHLAGYRLEERASPYFKLFLPEVLKVHCQTTIKLPIIPELPYLKGQADNRSPKVDFFALSDDGTRAFFIELKTDMNSLDAKQIGKLEDAAKRGICPILADLKLMANPKNKQSRQKYRHLLHRLSELGVNAVQHKPSIVYILPSRNSTSKKNALEKVADCIITFEQFANVIKERGTLGERFAESLCRWIEPAGSQPPGAN